MASEGSAASGGTNGTARTLSTGHRVELPLVTEATITGAVVSADRDAVRELLSDPLRPIRTAAGRAGVTLLCVEYHRIGRGSGIDRYNEFGIVVPAVPGSRSPFPSVSALTRGAGGYVWYLPVTTEPARALGVDIWGYPKEIAAIRHEDRGGRRRTSVSVDGRRVIDVTRRKTGPCSGSGRNSTGSSGSGRTAAVSRTNSVDHPRARRLRSLGFGGTCARTLRRGDGVRHPRGRTDRSAPRRLRDRS